MRGRDLLTIAELTADEVETILQTALSLKHDGGGAQLLHGKTLALIFEKPSLRTRVSFDVAMAQLGGNSVYLNQAEVGLGQREPVADVAQVLRLTREALSNIARHAAATHVEVTVHARGDRVELRIRDDGRGFDTTAPPRPGHHGLGNMRARALELGATLDVESSPGRGTTMRLSIPLRDDGGSEVSDR